MINESINGIFWKYIGFFCKEKIFKTNESNENSEKLDYQNILNYLHMNTLLMKNLENQIHNINETIRKVDNELEDKLYWLHSVNERDVD